MEVIDWSKVDEALNKAVISYGSREGFPANIKSAVSPGAVLLVGQGGEVLYQKAFGYRSIQPNITVLKPEMIFDIASLTKALITTTITMQLVDKGDLALDSRLSRIFQTFTTHGKEAMNILHLLSHTSGFPATSPYYKTIARVDNSRRSGVLTGRTASEIIYNEIFRTKLENMSGKVCRYSDIGFMLLGYALEVVTGTSLDKLAIKNVIKPLRLANTGYIDLASIKNKDAQPDFEIIVPTALCPWRGRVLCGEVHDDNAWAMGGVAAHAGIFSNAHDLHLFASAMIDSYYGRNDFISSETVRKFWTIAGLDPQSTWALGWDTPSKQGSSSGKYFSPTSVGHLGFTGCSIWIDPLRELDVILLTNRVHPSTDNNLIREFRPVIHDLVMDALGYAN